MKHTIHNKSSSNHPQSSEVKKILLDLQIKKDHDMRNFSKTMAQSFFLLKLQKKNQDIKQKRKSEIFNNFSPPKWKVSTNINFEFGRNQRVKQKFLTTWQAAKNTLSKRSYQNPKDFHGIKCDYFSHQFSKDLRQANSKELNKKLKQIQLNHEKNCFDKTLNTIKQKNQKSIQAIKNRGTRFQLSKDKLFGFLPNTKKIFIKNKQRDANNNFYSVVNQQN